MIFFINSLLLGIGLAMDAFSVSIANGLSEPDMKNVRRAYMAGVYALFQFIMPLIGWFFVRMLVSTFRVIEPFIPWIALILLTYIGVKMIMESKSTGDVSENKAHIKLSNADLLLQGVATSIDALSVGFTIDSYSLPMALLCAFIIAVTTFVICMAGLRLGIRFGQKLSGRATIAGGCILIFIGLEIMIRGVFL